MQPVLLLPCDGTVKKTERLLLSALRYDGSDSCWCRQLLASLQGGRQHVRVIFSVSVPASAVGRR
jgi:hypothetical protein